MVKEKRPTRKTPPSNDQDGKGGKNRAATEGPNGKKLGPDDQVPDTDPGRDTDPAKKPPESASEEQTDSLTAIQGEPDPAGTSAISPMGDLDGTCNGSSERMKEGEGEKIASELKPVGTLAGKSNTEEDPVATKNLPLTSEGAAQEDIELEKLR